MARLKKGGPSIFRAQFRSKAILHTAGSSPAPIPLGAGALEARRRGVAPLLLAQFSRSELFEHRSKGATPTLRLGFALSLVHSATLTAGCSS